MKKVRTELWIVSIVFLLLAGIVFIYSGLDSTGTTTPRGGGLTSVGFFSLTVSHSASRQGCLVAIG
jgi:hypothetical protein